MSPFIARALHVLFHGEHEVKPLKDVFPQAITDVEWIARLSRDGHWVVISGDRRITRNKAEQAAFRSSRLTGFFLTPGLQKAPVIKQTERILALWPSILATSEAVAPGAMYELPMKSSKLRQLRP